MGRTSSTETKPTNTKMLPNSMMKIKPELKHGPERKKRTHKKQDSWSRPRNNRNMKPKVAPNFEPPTLKIENVVDDDASNVDSETGKKFKTLEPEPEFQEVNETAGFGQMQSTGNGVLFTLDEFLKVANLDSPEIISISSDGCPESFPPISKATLSKMDAISAPLTVSYQSKLPDLFLSSKDEMTFSTENERNQEFENVVSKNEVNETAAVSASVNEEEGEVPSGTLSYSHCLPPSPPDSYKQDGDEEVHNLQLVPAPDSSHIVRAENGKYRCTVCDRQFERPWNPYHKYCAVIAAGLDSPFKCHICHKSLRCSSHLKYHISRHKDERPYPCVECGSSFVTPSKLKRHVRMTHQGYKPSQCDRCLKWFSSSSALKSHVLRHVKVDGGEKKTLGCLECGKKFRTQKRMDAHKERVHENKPQHQCQVCSRRFTTERGLLSHQRNHELPKNLQCDSCNKRFKCSRDLHRHLFTHSGFKPFRCTVCSGDFRRKDNIIRHLKTVHRVTDEQELNESIVNNGQQKNLSTHVQTYSSIEADGTGQNENEIENRNQKTQETEILDMDSLAKLKQDEDAEEEPEIPQGWDGIVQDFGAETEIQTKHSLNLRPLSPDCTLEPYMKSHLDASIITSNTRKHRSGQKRQSRKRSQQHPSEH